MSDSRLDYQPLQPIATTRHSQDNVNNSHSHNHNHNRTDSDDSVDRHDEEQHISEVQALVSPTQEQESFTFSQTYHGSESNQNKDSVKAAEWAIRMQAFFCAAMLGVSTHFTMHITGPLKDVLKENMGISNTQFSLLQSSLTLFPTLVPLIGGLLVERYGTGPSSIVFTTIVILGQVIVILGCWTHSIKIMVIGYCLFGIGAAPITIIQETIWVRYFRKNGLALVLALGLTSGKLAGFAALAGAYPLSTLNPFGFVTPFLVSLIISVIAWVMNIVFLILLKKPKEGADTMTKITILLKAKRTSLGWREVYGFSSMFWCILTISFLVGASWNPFMHQASNIVKHRYELNDEQAAWQASIILAIPLVIYPFLGTFIDHAGKRAWLLLVTAGLLICTHVLLLIPYSAVPIPPTIPMLLFALSLSLGTLSIVTSMPVLTKHVPTGLGLHRSIDNIGATLFGTVSGMMQDFSRVDADGESETESFFDRLYYKFFPVKVDLALQEREDVQLLGMFLLVALLLFIACAVFVWGDYYWTDGEGGKTGLLDEQDAEEVSMAEIGSSTLGFHSSNQTINRTEATSEQTERLLDAGAYGRDRHGRRAEEDEDSDSEDEDSQDESGEERFGVRIESGDDEIPRNKKLQAHFWIMFWTALLLCSWAVFGIGISR
ncbi:hypothetical protein BG006_008822 [Podila minutissima]|uniref:Lysosomal dipeptide transporter MFSD1 n=1 Tax=Podila minutissima TaxID=64525 RepID=A0A9P5SVB3_9FUNG|nr:hypothetical protein BG006_008822 [Podila minutissima]